MKEELENIISQDEIKTANVNISKDENIKNHEIAYEQIPNELESIENELRQEIANEKTEQLNIKDDFEQVNDLKMDSVIGGAREPGTVLPQGYSDYHKISESELGSALADEDAKKEEQNKHDLQKALSEESLEPYAHKIANTIINPSIDENGNPPCSYCKAPESSRSIISETQQSSSGLTFGTEVSKIIYECGLEIHDGYEVHNCNSLELLNDDNKREKLLYGIRRLIKYVEQEDDKEYQEQANLLANIEKKVKDKRFDKLYKLLDKIEPSVLGIAEERNLSSFVNLIKLHYKPLNELASKGAKTIEKMAQLTKEQSEIGSEHKKDKKNKPKDYTYGEQSKSKEDKHIIPVVIDGPNFINRILDMNIDKDIIAKQITVSGLINLIDKLLQKENLNGKYEFIEFVCSQRMFGHKSSKFTQKERDSMLSRLASEKGVHIEEVKLPGNSEKGVDNMVSTKIETFSEKHEYIVLVSHDRDYIPLLQKMRAKGKKIVLVAFNKSFPDELINEGYLVLNVENDYEYLFAYNYPTFKINSDFTIKEYKDLISNADDRKLNQVRVDMNGYVYIDCNNTGSENISGVKFRYETSCARNGYVGPKAASDLKYIEKEYNFIMKHWKNDDKGFIDCVD